MFWNLRTSAKNAGRKSHKLQLATAANIREVTRAL
jgi:hypothetical protein